MQLARQQDRESQRLDAVRAITAKDILICETSCVEEGGSKAAWIAEFFAWLPTAPLAGFLWFEIDNNPNWLVESSSSSLAAFKKGLVAYCATMET